MGWLVLTVLAVLLAAGGWFFGRSIYKGATKRMATADPNSRYYVEYEGDAKMGRLVSYASVGGVFVVWLIITAFMMFYTVDEREVAVVRSFGQITSTNSDPGPSLKAPWHSVEKYSTGTEIITVESAAVSKETQDVTGQLQVSFHVDPENVKTLATTIGTNWKDLIPARVQQAFKEQTVKYFTVDIAPNRSKLRADTSASLAADLGKRGIIVEDVVVENLGFPPELNKAITAKQVAQQQAEQAKNVTKQRIEEAEQARAVARGTADANRILADSLRTSPELLEVRLAEERTKQIIELAKSKQIQLVPAQAILNLGK